MFFVVEFLRNVGRYRYCGRLVLAPHTTQESKVRMRPEAAAKSELGMQL